MWWFPHGPAARRAPPPPWAPWSSPGNDPDVKARLTPGVHEGKQPLLEVGQAVHVALCEAHLVLQEQGHTHLRGDTPQAAALQPGPGLTSSAAQGVARASGPKGPEASLCNSPPWESSGAQPRVSRPREGPPPAPSCAPCPGPCTHTHTHPCVYTHIPVHAHTYTYIHVCTHPPQYACTHPHPCAHTDIHVHRYPCTDIHAHMHTHVRTHTPMYIHRFMCVHTHPCSHTYAHTGPAAP